MKPVLQALCDPVPIMTVVSTPMHKYSGGRQDHPSPDNEGEAPDYSKSATWSGSYRHRDAYCSA